MILQIRLIRDDGSVIDEIVVPIDRSTTVNFVEFVTEPGNPVVLSGFTVSPKTDFIPPPLEKP